MKKVLFIDSCIRGEQSRTKKIANVFIDKLQGSNEYEIETIVLDEIAVAPLGRGEYEHREKLLASNKTDDAMFDLPKQFAKADLIVVAAPFWDMGIPAKLKAYFENVSVSGFTFGFDGELFTGLCRAERMVYITTRGMDIDDNDEMEQASPYLIALCKFFGIKGFSMISASSLDVKPNEVGERMATAMQKAEKAAEEVLCQ